MDCSYFTLKIITKFRYGISVLFFSLLQFQTGYAAEPTPEFPRIGMLWSAADGNEDLLTKWSRYNCIVLGVSGMDLQWNANFYSDMAETFQPNSVINAQKKLAALQKKNPRIQVFCEILFFEARTNAYPSDSPWWYRDSKGNKVQFWQGCNNMAISNLQYIEHIVRRIEALYDAFGGQVGVFLDNLRNDTISQYGWTELLQRVRKRCSGMPILVNAGYSSDGITWVAPLVNGFVYENAVNKTADGNKEKFYARLQQHWNLLQAPRYSLNEVFGLRSDQASMQREIIRTLVYTDMLFLYSDSTYGHRHSWWPEWNVPLGIPVQSPAKPATTSVVRRDFKGGTVYWHPSTAKKNVTVKLTTPMIPFGKQKSIATFTLKPGNGLILLAR